MPSSPEQRITGLKIVAWTLRILTLLVMAYLIIQAAGLVLSAPSYNNFSIIMQSMIPFISLAVAIGLLEWGSSRVFDQVQDSQESLDQRIAGYIRSNRTTSFETLSRWVGIPQKRVADLAAKLAAEGQLSGYTIDLVSQSISNAPTVADPMNIHMPPPSYPRPQTSFNPSDEVVRVKAKLYELETLKKQGRIADNEYNEMKDELEKKLANLDTGTQVY